MTNIHGWGTRYHIGIAEHRRIFNDCPFFFFLQNGFKESVTKKRKEVSTKKKLYLDRWQREKATGSLHENFMQNFVSKKKSRANLNFLKASSPFSCTLVMPAGQVSTSVHPPISHFSTQPAKSKPDKQPNPRTSGPGRLVDRGESTRWRCGPR